MEPTTTLILGGARSGKSRHAEALVMRATPPWTYIATAETLDEEMRVRVAEHRARRGEDWQTREVPLDIAECIGAAEGSAILVDCLTIWLSNLMHATRDIDAETDRLVDVLDRTKVPVFLVANEVGLGIVPENALARRFRDAAGRLHQRLAAQADDVLMMVAGLPLSMKAGGRSHGE
jgi:adenosylcobinamide kinase / adenosylcobinamide-phosphate guanylyltransferase